jgi:serine beta-lactamase-like protein LACTB, mitochondrial
MERLILLPMAWILIILATAAPVSPAAAQRVAANVATVETMLAAELSRWNAPGLSVAIVTDYRLLWSHGLGLADLEQQVPATAATVYRIASISKAITAIAVMQLAEHGKLDLDQPIQRYCPAFPQKPWPITSRQLLAHLGGIRGYRNDEEFFSTRHYQSVVESLSLFKDDPLLYEPGTQFSYTTYGYNVLGCIVEGASGMRYVDYVREHIFQPAGMRQTRPDDVFTIIPNRARAYRKTTSGEIHNAPLADTSNKIPGGGFCGTVEDLAKFAIALQRGNLTTKVTLEHMFTSQKTRDGQDVHFGLGWAVERRNGQQEVWHLGGAQGVSNILYMQPEQGLAVTLLVNINGLATPASAAPILGLARRIAEIVSPHPHPLPARGISISGLP